MIAGIDHIALSSGDCGKAVRLMESLGYRLAFSDCGVKNPAIKRDYMTGTCLFHDLSFLKSEGSLNIEVIDHGRVNGRRGSIMPVFENAPRHMFETVGGREDMHGESLLNGRFYGSDIHAYFVEGNDGSSHPRTLSRIVVKTPDIARSASFWSALGFRSVSAGDGFAVLEFGSIMNRDRFLLCLEEATGAPGAWSLDDAGFNCIALASSSVDRDRETLIMKNGIRPSGIESLTVNGKPLRIFFARGPCGEIAEIIGIGGKNEKTRE